MLTILIHIRMTVICKLKRKWSVAGENFLTCKNMICKEKWPAADEKIVTIGFAKT